MSNTLNKQVCIFLVLNAAKCVEKASTIEASAAQTQHQIRARHHSNLPDQNEVWMLSKQPKPVELDLHIPHEQDGVGS